MPAPLSAEQRAAEQKESGGAWGQLRTSDLWLVPPEESVRAADCVTELAPWALPTLNAAALKRLLADAPLSAAQRSTLEGSATCDPMGGGCTLRPDRGLIAALGPEARSALYTTLSRFPQNKPQFYAYRWRNEQRQPFLAAARQEPALGATLAARLEGLLYSPKRSASAAGEIFQFSDLETLCPTLSEAQRRGLLKVLGSTPSRLVELVVPPKLGPAALERLVAYWGQGGRAAQVRPILLSLSRRPGGGAIDISHLLPRFARDRVYTYPSPGEPEQSCHYSALNFFAQEPDRRFLQDAAVGQALLDEYTIVTPAEDRHLGDVIALQRPDGSVLHTMAFIAADLVFTKNGFAARVPWVLERLSDVRALYQVGAPDLREVIYRRRATAAQAP